MLIKCENCSKVYFVPDDKLESEHPHYFKCVSCGSVFPAHLPQELSTDEMQSFSLDDIAPLPQEDVKAPLDNDVASDETAQVLPQQAPVFSDPLPSAPKEPMDLKDIFAPALLDEPAQDNTDVKDNVILDGVTQTPAWQIKAEQEAKATLKKEELPAQSVDLNAPMASTFDADTSSNVASSEVALPAPENKSIIDSGLFTPLDQTDEFAPMKATKGHALSRFVWGFCSFWATLVLLGYLFYAGRYYFARRSPVAEALYNKMNVSTSVAGEGLAFQNTLFDLEKINTNAYRLHIQSEVFNTTQDDVVLPDILVILTDAKGQIITTNLVETQSVSLGSGKTFVFSDNIEPIDQTAQKVELTFSNIK